MPSQRRPRVSPTSGQDLIRRIHRHVLPQARRLLDRSDERMSGSVAAQLESAQRLLEAEPPIGGPLARALRHTGLIPPVRRP